MIPGLVQDMLNLTNEKDTVWCYTTMQMGSFQKKHSHAQTNIFPPTTRLGNTTRNVVQRQNGLKKNLIKLESA